MRNHDSMGCLNSIVPLSPLPFISGHCHWLAYHKLT